MATHPAHGRATIGVRVMATVAAAHPGAASLTPHGGGAVVILNVSIFVGVAAGLVAIETHRNQYLWMLAGFVAALVLISGCARRGGLTPALPGRQRSRVV